MPHPRPVLLRAFILLLMKARISPLLIQGLKLHLNPCLTVQNPPPLVLHPQLLLQMPLLLQLKNLLPLFLLLGKMATLQPYPLSWAALKAPVGLLQLHRKLA